MQKFLSRFNLPKYLIAAVLIIVVLFPKFPFIRIPGIYVSVRFEDFLLLILGIVTIIKVIPNIKTILKDKVIAAFLVFFAVGAVSLLSAVFLSQTASLSIGLLHFLRRIEYAIPFFAVLILFNKQEIKENLDFYIKILMIVISIAFLYGIGQRFLSFPVIDTQNDEYSKGIALLWTQGAHINSTFAGHYDLAAFMVLVLPIFSTLFFVTNKMKVKILSLLIVIPGLWLLGASLARVSLASWIIASVIPLIILKKYKQIVFILIAAMLVVISFPSLLGRYQRFLDVYAADQVTVSVSPRPVRSTTPTPVPVFEDRSTSIRVNVEWPRAIRAFEKNPLIGSGYSSIGLASDNDYLRMLAEIGLLGLLAFALIFIRIGKKYWGYLKSKADDSDLSKSFTLGILGAVIGTFATATFIDIFEASKFATIFWLLLGYSLFLIRTSSNDQ